MALSDMFESFFHPEEGYQAAQKQIEEAMNRARSYQQPFLNAGTSQLPILQNAQNQLLDPETLQNRWAAGYQTSPEAQDAINRSKSQGLDAASSMGLLGSSAALNNIQNNAGQIANKDRENYMNQLMQKYMQGIGIGQDIYGKGAGIGESMGHNELTSGEDLGSLAYGEKTAPGALLGQLMSSVMQYVQNNLSGGLGPLMNSAGGAGSAGAASALPSVATAAAAA